MEHTFGNHEISKTIDLSQYQISYEEGTLQVRKSNHRKVVEAARHFFGFFGFGVKHVLSPHKNIWLKKEAFFHIGRTLWGNEKEFDRRFRTDEEKKMCTHALLATIKSPTPRKILSKETLCKKIYAKTRLPHLTETLIAHIHELLLPSVSHLSEEQKERFLNREVYVFLIKVIDPIEQPALMLFLRDRIGHERSSEAKEEGLMNFFECIVHLASKEQKKEEIKTFVSLVQKDPSLKRELLVQKLLKQMLGGCYREKELFNIEMEAIRQLVSTPSEKAAIKECLQKIAQDRLSPDDICRWIEERLTSE